MILYLDTSAFVPLLVEEPTSASCGELWDAADRLVTTRLTYVESANALAMADRIGRITTVEHEAGRERLAELWPEVDVLELREQLMVAAGDAARPHALCGYDSVHFAAAVALDDQDLVAAAGDANLLAAWRRAGLAVVDIRALQPTETTDGAPDPGDQAP